ncbi:uncharacterized protein LOC144705261 isoform X2 [Wolffia australiana]
MAVGSKEVRTYIWKFLVVSLVNISRSVYEHPFYVGLSFFVIFLNRFLPFLLQLLVSTTPVFICCGLLLGILLCYGQPSTPRMEHKTVHRSPSALNDTADNIILMEKGAKNTTGKEQESSINVHHASRRPFLLEPDEAGERHQPDLISLVSLSEADMREPLINIGGSIKRSLVEEMSKSTENSSPDASVTDVIPMLDELHPLLDSESIHLANTSVNIVHSNCASDLEDEGSGDERVENAEDSADEEEKEEGGDGAELAVKWTEDDEKNVMVLGTSELERNQRLEKLIAKRRAWRNKIEAERNLIDLDGGEIASTSGGLSHFQAQIPSISIARQNPFDLPYDSKEAFGLHSVPGSAPSVLLPRQNPFDSPPHPADEGNMFSGFSLNQQSGIHQREQLFRRHESFAHVTPFSADIKFRPYFVSERMTPDDTSFAHLQRLTSDKTDSEVSSSEEESDSKSSVSDQDFEDENQETKLQFVSETKTSGADQISSDRADLVSSVSDQDSENKHQETKLQFVSETKTSGADQISSDRADSVGSVSDKDSENEHQETKLQFASETKTSDGGDRISSDRTDSVGSVSDQDSEKEHQETELQFVSETKTIDGRDQISSDGADSASSVSDQDSEKEHQETEVQFVSETKTFDGRDQISSDGADSASSSQREMDLSERLDLHASANDFIGLEDQIQEDKDSCSKVSEGPTTNDLILQTEIDSSRNSTFSFRSVIADADVVAESLSVEPVYDLSPSAVEKSLAQVEEGFTKVNILLTSLSSTEDVPSDKKIMGELIKEGVSHISSVEENESKSTQDGITHFVFSEIIKDESRLSESQKTEEAVPESQKIQVSQSTGSSTVQATFHESPPESFLKSLSSTASDHPENYAQEHEFKSISSTVMSNVSAHHALLEQSAVIRKDTPRKHSPDRSDLESDSSSSSSDSN